MRFAQPKVYTLLIETVVLHSRLDNYKVWSGHGRQFGRLTNSVCPDSF